MLSIVKQMLVPHTVVQLRGFVACGLFFAAAVGRVSPVLGRDLDTDLPTVHTIEILGNRSFDDGTLKKHMRTKEPRFYHVFRKPKFRRDFLRRDVQALQSFYNRNGFFEAVITVDAVERDERSNSVRIRLLVNEGPQSIVSRVTFTGTLIFPERKLIQKLKLLEGQPYNPNLLEVDRYSLFSNYFERGYLGASIAYDVGIDSTAVALSWRIDPREPVRIDSIDVGGNEKVSERLVRRELIFERGEYFNLKKVLESKQNLYDTGYFYSVEIEPQKLDMVNREVDIMLQLRERKMGYVETGLGFGNVHGNRLFAEWGQRNLFKQGYALNLKTAYAFRLFQDNEYSLEKMDFRSKFVRHEGELRFPHVLNTWNTFALGAFYERDATVEPAIVKAVSLNANVSRRFSRNTSLLFGYALERITRLEVEEEKEKSRRRSLELTVNRDTRDYYFNPSRGNYVTLDARVSGGLLGGEDHFYSLVSSFQSYRLISRSIVFAYRIRTGYADAFGDSRESGLPIESRFFAGGGNSVRGYRENSLGPRRDDSEPRGGRVLLLTNLELRFPLPLISRFNFGGAAFCDGGNVWSSVREINADHFKPVSGPDDTTYQDYRYGVGFGIRYNTPVGPIRFDVGFPLKKTMDIDYNYWIHISLGQIF